MERFLNAVPYIPRIQNTSTWWGFMQICKRLFAFEGQTVNLDNAEALYRKALEKLQGENWYLTVLDQIKIRKAFLTNEFDEDLCGYNRDVFIPALRVDGWINQITDINVIERLKACTDCDVTSLAQFKSATRKVAESFKEQGAVSMAISLPPDFRVFPVADATAEGNYN